MSGQIPGSSLAAEKAIKRGAKPDLMILKKFPGKLGKFDVLEKIGTSYNNFGTFLLQDSDGSKVSAIEKAKQLDCYSICEEIVKKWLKGEGKEPVTYATLVECLRDAKLNVLAGDIEDRLGSGGATASATSSDQPLAVRTVVSSRQPQYIPPVGHTPPGMTTPTLEELIDNVRTTEWFRLGLKLGVKQFDLEVIDRDKRLDTSGALMAVFRKWLQQNENPMWEVVVVAMRDIGEMREARSLEDNFC